MITENYTSNECLQLLWVHYKEPNVELELTREELKYLELTIIDEWDTLTTHYKNQLVTKDKLELLSRMSNGKPLFS